MRIVPIVVALLLAPTLAGCLAPFTERFRATNVEAPEWRVGDWWTYRLTSEIYSTAADITVVVADRTTDGFVLGTPVGDDVTFGLLQHMPAIGPVHSTLAWDVHETRFEPLRFPLRDGLEWDTTWIAATVHLRVRAENGTWNVSNEGFEEEAGLRYDIIYDPAVKWFTSFVRKGLDGTVRQSLQLVDNGTGYVGDVRVVGNIRVVLLEARSQGVLSGGVPAAPNPTFTPPESASTLLVGCVAGGAPGQYHAEVRSPTGVICNLDESIPPGDAIVRTSVVEVDTEAGTWEARLLAIGQGSAFAEVLGYTTNMTTLG